MAVGEQNMGRAGLFGIAGEFRIAGEEWVDEDDRRAKLDAKCRMAEPNKFHGMRSSKTLSKAESGFNSFVLSHFLDANRCSLRWKMLSKAS